MDTINAFAIIILAALIHASFQLSVSVLTLLSGHAIGADKSHKTLVRLNGSFILGTAVMTMLVLSTVALMFLNFLPPEGLLAAWTLSCGLLVGVGLAVWLLYYRRHKNGSLWIPPSVSDYLSGRAKSTQLSAEAFSLGLTSVVAELLFIITPITVAAIVLIQLPPVQQVLGIAAYTLLSVISLLIVATLIGGGHKLSQIQKWRESNKYFIQAAAGAGLIVLAGFIYISEVLSVTTGGF